MPQMTLSLHVGSFQGTDEAKGLLAVDAWEWDDAVQDDKGVSVAST